MEQKGFLPRLIAALIDGILVFFLVSIVSLVFGAQWLTGTGLNYIGGLIISIAVLAYSYLDVLWAQTPGKKVLDLKIMSKDGSEASEAILQKRWLVKYSGNLVGLVAALTTLGFLDLVSMLLGIAISLGCFLIFTAEKLTLHDILSETSVFGPKKEVAA